MLLLKTASAILSRSRRRSRGESAAGELPPQKNSSGVVSTVKQATMPSETPTSSDEVELDLVVLQTGWAHLAEELLAKIFRTMLLEVAPASCSQKGGESTLSFACLALACRSWHQAVLAVAVRRWAPHGLKGLNARDAAGHTPLHHATKAGADRYIVGYDALHDLLHSPALLGPSQPRHECYLPRRATPTACVACSLRGLPSTRRTRAVSDRNSNGQ